MKNFSNKTDKDTVLYIIFAIIFILSFLLPWTENIDGQPNTYLSGIQYIITYPLNEVFPIALGIILMPVFAFAIAEERLRKSRAKLERIFFVCNMGVFVSNIVYHINRACGEGMPVQEATKYFFSQLNFGILVGAIGVIGIFLLGEKNRGHNLLDKATYKKDYNYIMDQLFIRKK